MAKLSINFNNAQKEITNKDLQVGEMMQTSNGSILMRFSDHFAYLNPGYVSFETGLNDYVKGRKLLPRESVTLTQE